MTLRVGIMLPSRETAMTGKHDARGLVEFARAAEAAGFDSVWVGDSLLARTRAEPLSILAAVAAMTERVTLGTAALIAPLRHPLLAAAQAATVDQLSAGRLILGLGSGSPLPESRARCRRSAVAPCRNAWIGWRITPTRARNTLRIGSLTARPESVADKLLPALKEIGSP
jgi:hypothetical protein